MRVKLNKNIKFLYRGEIKTPGVIFEYNGAPQDFLTPVTAAESKAFEEMKERQKAAQEKLAAQRKIESELPDEVVQNSVQETSGPELIIDQIDFSDLSPQEIQAKILEFESKEESKENISEEINEKPMFKLVKKGRGWYDVKNEKGRKITPKKVRKDEAIKLIESLGGQYEEK